jgi:hypothetical protein
MAADEISISVVLIIVFTGLVTGLVLRKIDELTSHDDSLGAFRLSSQFWH